MNNGLYPAGWTHYGMVMGSPFILSYSQIAHLEPELGARNILPAGRRPFSRYSIGAAGDFSDEVSWDHMMSITRNYGSYVHQYTGRIHGVETPSYFFKGGKDQFMEVWVWNGVIKVEWIEHSWNA